MGIRVLDASSVHCYREGSHLGIVCPGTETHSHSSRSRPASSRLGLCATPSLKALRSLDLHNLRTPVNTNIQAPQNPLKGGPFPSSHCTLVTGIPTSLSNVYLPLSQYR